MILVYLESPYAGDIPNNIAYARAAMADCIARGEAPFASHLLYTQEGILREDIPGERALGIACGFAWAANASRTVVYVDRGISRGMIAGIEAARSSGRAVQFREFGCDLEAILDPARRPQAATLLHTFVRVRFRELAGLV
jgi:hypothetical protein